MKTDELVKRLREHAEWAQANEWEVPITLADDLEVAAKRVEEAEHENVDAVPVVRCKDCLYWENATHFCHYHSHYYDGGRDWDRFKPDDFCSYGERKEGAEDG